MSHADLSQFDDLVSRWLDDSLTDADAGDLLVLLEKPSRATQFLEMSQLNSEIAGLLAAPVPDAAMAELVLDDIGENADEAKHLDSVGFRIPNKRMSMLLVVKMAAVFFMLAGLATLVFVKRTKSAESLVIASVKGEVVLTGPAGGRVLNAGDSWQRGDTVRTIDQNSNVVMTFRDGTRLEFGGNSIALNQSTKDGRRVQLEHGDVRAEIKGLPTRIPFAFATSEAEAMIIRATLRIRTGVHRTQLDVIDGEVRFRRRHDGAEVAVKAGQFAVVAPGVSLVARPIASDPHHSQ